MEAERIARTGESESIRKTLAYWRKVTSSIEGTTGKFGDRLTSAFKKTLGDASAKTGLLGERSKQAAEDFAVADKAGFIEGTTKIGLQFWTSYESTLGTWV